MDETAFRMALEPCAVLQLEAWSGAVAGFEADIARQLGVDLPLAVGETVRFGGWLAVRVAPRRCWLVSESAPLPALHPDPELGCALLLAEGRMCLRLGGARLFEVLAACVAIDWEAPRAAPGRALAVGWHRVPVLVLRTDTQACDVLVPRSFARSLADWVTDVAAPHRADPGWPARA